MVVLMILAFLVAWLPYAVVCIIVMAGGQHLISATAAGVAPVFAKTSMVYNPIIYVLLNTQVRLSAISGFGSDP
nr:ciliary opsin [Ramazzottius sp.]QYF06575.1 ciliary opsin [Ramazzottius sp.]